MMNSMFGETKALQYFGDVRYKLVAMDVSAEIIKEDQPHWT